MEIKINDVIHKVKIGSTLYEILKSHEIHEQKGIAVAINNAIIPKSLWISTPLQHQDHLLIIKATQGG